MVWQYIVEIHLPYAMLVAAVIVGLGYGTCWMLVARPSKKRADQAVRQAEDESRGRRRDARRLSDENSNLERDLQRAEMVLAEERRSHAAAEAEGSKRIESLQANLSELKEKLSEQTEELRQALGRERDLAARETEPRNKAAKPDETSKILRFKRQQNGSSGAPDSRLPGHLDSISQFFMADRVVLIRKSFSTVTQTSIQPSSRYVVNMVMEYAMPQNYGSEINHIIKEKWTLEAGFDAKLREALADYTAKKIDDSAWRMLAERQITVDPGRLDAAAQAIDNFKAGMHELILARPAETIMNIGGVPRPGSALAGGVLAEIPLPIDRPLAVAERSICVAEIVVGIVPPLHPLAVHGMQGLTQDMAVSALKEGIKRLEVGAAERLARSEAARPEVAGQEAPVREAAQLDAARLEAAKREAARLNAAAREAARQLPGIGRETPGRGFSPSG